jgi:hypothetical protein
MPYLMFQDAPCTLGQRQQARVGLLTDKDNRINLIIHAETNATFEAGGVKIRNIEDVETAEVSPVLYGGPDFCAESAIRIFHGY